MARSNRVQTRMISGLTKQKSPEAAKRGLIKAIRAGTKRERQHEANRIMRATDIEAGGYGEVATDVEEDDECFE
jgi:hypothetical protein